MKTFTELREELDEIAYKKDKKNHISSTKIKKTEVAYHSERKGSKKIRVFVKPKSSREFEELGVFKDMKTAQKSAEQFVKLMGEDIWGRPLLILAILLVVVGIQFFSIGILYDLLMKTYFESQKKNPFKIRKITRFDE